MAVNYPTSLDTLTNPSASDYLNSPSHAGQHADANDILEALEAKVGINSSAVTTSHDYKLSLVTGTAKALPDSYLDTDGTLAANSDVKIATQKAVKTYVSSAGVRYAADAQASDTYIITSGSAVSYAAGDLYTFKANTANTGAATLNVNSIGAVTIKKNKDRDLGTGDIKAGQIVIVQYDGTNFQMQSQLGTEVIFGKLRRSTNQSIPNATWTKFLCATLENEIGNIDVDEATNNRININKTGLYRFIVYGIWTANTTGRRIMGFGVNGSVVEDFYVGMDSSGDYRVAHMGFANLNAGDYVTLHGYQNSGGALNATGYVAVEFVSP